MIVAPSCFVRLIGVASKEKRKNMAQNPPRIVRRGNTSGLIGLWNGKSQHENSSNVTADSLKIRQEANRRTSARDPPKLEDLEQFRVSSRIIQSSEENKQVMKEYSFFVDHFESSSDLISSWSHGLGSDQEDVRDRQTWLQD